jgi:hypothetical protein
MNTAAIFRFVVRELKLFVLFKGWTWSTVAIAAVPGLYLVFVSIKGGLWRALIPHWWMTDYQEFLNGFLLIAMVSIWTYPFLFISNLSAKYCFKNALARLALIPVAAIIIAASFVLFTAMVYMG